MFDREQHTLNLPAVNSITYVLRFLEKLCHNLRSDNLFGNQPFTQNSHMQRSHEYDHDRYLPDRSSSLDGSLQGPGRGTKRYSQDSPPYSAPLSPKLPKNDHHPLEGEHSVSSQSWLFPVPCPGCSRVRSAVPNRAVASGSCFAWPWHGLCLVFQRGVDELLCAEASFLHRCVRHVECSRNSF